MYSISRVYNIYSRNTYINCDEKLRSGEIRVQSTIRVLPHLIKVDSIKLFIDSRRLLRFLMSSSNVSNVYSIKLETKDWVSNRQNV